MPFGSFYSGFDYIDYTTADEKCVHFRNTLVTSMGFRVLGVPHIGLRLRSRKVLGNVPGSCTDMLDAGCGGGIYSYSLVKRVKRIEAVDISKKGVEYAKKSNPYKNINFNRKDLCNLEYPDCSFDLIICTDVLEHIKDDQKAFSELARVLKNGGTMLVTLPNDSKKNRKDYRTYMHKRPGYGVKQFRKMVRKNGCILTKVEGYSFPTAEGTSEFSYRFMNNKVLFAVMFYPLYLVSLIGDARKRGEPNGMFFLVQKT